MYKVGDKFVIEIERVSPPVDRNREKDVLYRVKGFNTLVFDDYGLDKLQKYEDSEYAEGVKEGLNSFDCEVKKAYEKGLQDAWELARKMTSWTYSDRRKVLEFGYSSDAFMQHTYQEALAKIEAYEESKAIKVGDVVRRITDDEEYLIITKEDNNYSVYKYGVIVLKTMLIDRITGELSKFEKTGRHIDIEHLLEQIRGNE